MSMVRKGRQVSRVQAQGKPIARRRRARRWLVAGLAAGAAVALIMWAHRPAGPRSVGPRSAGPRSPVLPPARYEEQADGANRVIVDPGLMADFCRSVGLPEPPVLAEIDGVLAQALYEAHRSVAADPPSAAACGHLGDLYQAHEYADLAIACYQRAAALADSFEWHYQMSRIHARESRPAEEIECLRHALALNPDYVPALFHLAESLLNLGRLEEAEEAYRQYVQRAPNDANGYVGLAMVARMRQNDDEAMRHFQAALARNPRDYRVHFHLAQLHRARGDMERYEHHQGLYQSLPKRIDLSDPLASRIRWLGTSPEQVQGIAEDLQLQGRSEEALDFCREAVRRRPRHAQVLAAQAAAHHGAGQAERALEVIQQSIALDANQVSSLYVLGEIGLSLERWPEVIETAERAIGLDRSRDFPYWLKGQALQRTGRLAEAIESYTLAAQRAPDSYPVCLSLGVALQQADRLGEAGQAYEQALRARPADEEASHRLRYVRQVLKDRASSLPYRSSRPADASSRPD